MCKEVGKLLYFPECQPSMIYPVAGKEEQLWAYDLASHSGAENAGDRAQPTA